MSANDLGDPPDTSQVAALVLTVAGSSTFNVLPLLTSGAADTMGLRGDQVGLLSLAICGASAASALLAGIWVRSVPWRRAALFSLMGMLATNAGSMMAHSLTALIFLQGAAGFFGTAALCLGLTILSDRPESARSFGICNAAQVVYQVLAILAGPTLMRQWGFNGILAMLAVPPCFVMLLMRRLPDQGKALAAGSVPSKLLRLATVLALLSFCIFFINAGAYWTYIELIGEARGMTPRVVANCVAVGVSAGIVGGLAAWALGDRFGRFWPLCLSSVLIAMAALLLIGPFSATAFALSVVLYFLAWNCAVAYQLSIVNAVDPTGRGVAVTQAFAFLGTAAGAGITGLCVSPGDYSAVIWLVIAAVSVSTGLFALIADRHSSSTVIAPTV